jgi:hypothetical protein
VLKLNRLNSIAMIFALNLFITAGLSANWMKTETNSSIKKQEVSYQNEHAGSKSDSLPEGVSKDWLNSLRDKSGNRIFKKSGTEKSQRIPEDPEGDALQRKIFNGLSASENYGNSISSAGDVNGDGFDDIIAGAPGYSSGTGRAYIYFGGLITNTIADVVLTGEAASNSFGISVSPAGDVNGDGFSDVIVGAIGYLSNTGRAYIYFGGATMNNTADVTMTGEAAGNIFGYSVSTAGDVNGDGYSDVMVGANNYGGSLGKAYIFFGGASMNNTADVTMIGGTYLGSALSYAGDVNGDGYSDVIVGERDYLGAFGRAYIFLGGASMDNTADVTMTGEAAFNYFGTSVSSAGDVNGDGYSDVIIGARGYSANTGRAYIFFGGASMNNTADVTITGDTTNIYLGNSVSSAGDVNCDGYSDVIAGANGYSSSTGRAYIYFGGSSMNNTADLTMIGETTNSSFGASVSSAGDMNGDGYAEMIIGAPGYSSGTGRVYLYDYFMKNEITPDLSMTGQLINNSLGYSVSSAGDVNRDGYSDVVVGVPASGVNGEAFIFYGGAFMNNIADIVLRGAQSVNESFGTLVSSAGDVNGDGYSDVIVGARGNSSNTGKAYIFLGKDTMPSTAYKVLTGEAINNYFGNSVSSAGDVNGDGYSDVIVGAYQNSSFKGRAYIYFGGSVMDDVADLKMTGNTSGDVFGYSVSTAGDVNGDGYSDVIVGAYGYSSQTGRAYLFYGGMTMDTLSDLTMTAETAGSQFGYSVSSSGDVNGDGYSDVIVGALGYASNTGRAYLFFGGMAMDAVADVTMTGQNSNDFFGNTVTSAGDVNGDGYSDVIAGAYGNSSATGRAYVYLGGGSMNNSPDVTMTGESSNNLFGFSVSSAGDVNGDGYSDLISGTPGYNSDRGRAYIYLGSAISVKPILLSAKDVPDDQGGILNLKFAKSSLDVPSSEIGGINYQIDRSAPPNGNGYQWVSVASISGTYESFYTAEIHTPRDSGVSGNNTYFFRVTAVSNSTGKFWRSNILSGYSLDNIAPPIVSPFIATSAGSNVNLNWGTNSAPDLLNYVLFRSVNPVIDPYTETPLSTVTVTNYTDTSPLSGIYYYFIVAQDVNGNYSPVAVTESPNMTLNLTMFIEGFYNAGSDSQVSDTITVELRNSTSPFAVADQSTAVVSANGTVELRFANAPNGNYYIAVKHRNSIETWSASAIALSQTTPVNYDLASTSSQAFGNNIIQVDASPVRFAIYSGDVNQDGTVDATDVSTIDNDASNFVSGYVVTDLTGDNFVDGTDFAIADNNAANFVSVVRP